MAETNYAVAPGEYIQEWLEDNCRDAGWLATEIGATPEHVQGLLDGSKVMTVVVAVAIGQATGIEPRIWMSYEKQYRADLKRLAAGNQL